MLLVFIRLSFSVRREPDHAESCTAANQAVAFMGCRLLVKSYLSGSERAPPKGRGKS